jgi:hypothetical protein
VAKVIDLGVVDNQRRTVAQQDIGRQDERRSALSQLLEVDRLAKIKRPNAESDQPTQRRPQAQPLAKIAREGANVGALRATNSKVQDWTLPGAQFDRLDGNRSR